MQSLTHSGKPAFPPLPAQVRSADLGTARRTVAGREVGLIGIVVLGSVAPCKAGG